MKDSDSTGETLLERKLKDLPRFPDGDSTRLPEKQDDDQCGNFGIGHYEPTRTRKTVEADDGTFVVVTGIPVRKCTICGETLFPGYTKNPLLWIRKLTESDRDAVVRDYCEEVRRFRQIAERESLFYDSSESHKRNYL